MNDRRLFVLAENSSYEKESMKFAEGINLPFRGNLKDLRKEALDETRELDKQYFLILGKKSMYLKLGLTLRNKPIFCDFLKWSKDIRKSNLTRSMRGLPKDCTVIDATAGLGHDSLSLATLSNKVILLEKIPWVYALLKHGLNRAKRLKKSIFNKMHPVCDNARDYLLKTISKPDVIYLDPMFNVSTKSKAKKGVQALRELIPEENPDYLLQIALNNAKERVIVKRHRNDKFLENLSPTYSISGHVIRFDIYSVRKI